MISAEHTKKPDMFNVSVPGESLTQPQGNRPYEKPAEFDKPVDAFNNILETYYNPVTFGNVTKSLSAGVPIEFIVDIIVFSGFMSGKYTVDVAELIKPAFFLNILADSRDAGIDPILFSTMEGPGEMNPADFVNIMKEMRPEKHKALLAESGVDPEVDSGNLEDNYADLEGNDAGLNGGFIDPQGPQAPMAPMAPMAPQAPQEVPQGAYAANPEVGLESTDAANSGFIQREI